MVQIQKPWTSHEVARLILMREGGIPRSKIAAALGRTDGSVRGKMKKLDEQPRPSERNDPREPLEVRKAKKANRRFLEALDGHELPASINSPSRTRGPWA